MRERKAHNERIGREAPYTLRGLQQRSSMQHVPEECERLLDESSTVSTLHTTGHHSLENKIGFDIEVGRR